MLKTGIFPDNLKLADIIPVFKKKNPLYKDQLGFYLAFQISLKNRGKKQISGYISNYLSPYLCGYRKGFSSQQALISIFENWKKVLDKNGPICGLLWNKYYIAIHKRYAYGFNKDF